ncbi:hypothetical protein M758_UG080900 [Ceratodon purpureus]|nr:hypothetical protein M758_UG080900 [Ceratodon purpureus]
MISGTMSSSSHAQVCVKYKSWNNKFAAASMQISNFSRKLVPFTMCCISRIFGTVCVWNGNGMLIYTVAGAYIEKNNYIKFVYYGHSKALLTAIDCSLVEKAL